MGRLRVEREGGHMRPYRSLGVGLVPKDIPDFPNAHQINICEKTMLCFANAASR